MTALSVRRGLIAVALMFAAAGCVPKGNQFTPAERVDLMLESDLVVKTYYLDTQRISELMPFDALYLPGEESATMGKIEYLVTFKIRQIVKGEYNQPTLRVAVEMPVVVFGVLQSWNEGKKPYLFYLKHYPEGSGYYRVLGVEW